MMLRSTIDGLEKALEQLRELERLADLENYMALFDELNSEPIDSADRSTLPPGQNATLRPKKRGRK